MSDILNKNKEELLKDFVEDPYPLGSNTLQQTRAVAIFVHSVEDSEKSLESLENSMNCNAEASHDLAKKVLYLNIILVGATIILAIVGILNLFC